MQLKSQRGDTIIEAILALAIFALVTVSMFAIMQRATAGAYDSIERSQVRLLLNEQADVLAFLRDQYIKVTSQGASPAANTPAGAWKTIRDQAASAAIPAQDSCTPAADKAFYMTRTSPGVYELKTLYAAASGLPVPGQGIWIEKVDPQGSVKKRNFHDFYIRACWTTTTNNQQVLSSVVRLYEPN